MSFVKFYDYNLVTQDATTITASTEDSFYPASNIKDPRSTKVWRSTTTSDTVVFDFVTTESVDSILIRGSKVDANAFNTTVTIEANATDSWGAPAFSDTLTFDTTWNIGLKTLSSPQSYRYWRLSFTASNYVEVGNIFIGSYKQLTENNIDFGWTHERRDLSRGVANRYGQKFIDVLPKQLLINARFRLLNETELTTIADMFELVGTTEPLWVVIDENADIVDNKYRFAGMFYLSKIPRYTNSTPFLYDTSFQLEEAM